MCLRYANASYITVNYEFQKHKSHGYQITDTMQYQ